jgi:hypothetical protein
MLLLIFLLVAEVTAVVVLILYGLVLWIMGRARERRHAAEAMTTAAGRAQVNE